MKRLLCIPKSKLTLFKNIYSIKSIYSIKKSLSGYEYYISKENMIFLIHCISWMILAISVVKDVPQSILHLLYGPAWKFELFIQCSLYGYIYYIAYYNYMDTYIYIYIYNLYGYSSPSRPWSLTECEKCIVLVTMFYWGSVPILTGN